MAKQGTKATTPKLRFPEFRDAEPWGTAELSTLANRTAVKNANGRVTRVLTNSAEFGVLDQRDYFDKDIATAGKTDGYYVVEKGDYVYNPRTSAFAPVGPISRNDIGEGVMSPLYTVFRFSVKQTDFYRHYFHSTGWHSYLSRAASTGARHDRMSITNDAFMRMPLPVPARAEQQRIADCLTSLDEVVAAQGRKVQALKAHKRGLMQQLFPREGETRPRLRFPEFRNAPESKSLRFFDLIDDVLDFRGRTPAKLGMKWGGGDIISLSANNVKNGFIDYGAECNLASEELHSRWMAGTNLEAGDIVFTMEAPLGQALMIPDKRKYVLSQRVVAFKTKPHVVNEFLLQLIWSDVFQNAIGLLATGSTAKGVSQKSLQGLMVSLPENDEQHRIADCLAPLDTRIRAETARLVALKTHKQGLMQQLFPAPEAMGA